MGKVSRAKTKNLSRTKSSKSTLTKNPSSSYKRAPTRHNLSSLPKKQSSITKSQHKSSIKSFRTNIAGILLAILMIIIIVFITMYQDKIKNKSARIILTIVGLILSIASLFILITSLANFFV